MAMLKGRHEERKTTAALSTHRAREFNSLVSHLKRPFTALSGIDIGCFVILNHTCDFSASWVKNENGTRFNIYWTIALGGPGARSKSIFCILLRSEAGAMAKSSAWVCE